MITVSNTFIPFLKGRRKKIKGSQEIANTDAGDVAYYTTKIHHPSSDDEDDEDYMSEDDYRRDSFSHPSMSLTGKDWRPKFNDRMTVFIAGAPGAGKSYLAKQLIKLLPDTLDILLFTALEENDGNFDELGKDRLFKIRMHPDVLSQITLAKIRTNSRSPQTILLFDDVDKIRNPRVAKYVFEIMNDALANGRGHEKHDGVGDIHVICTSHSANDYIKTKYAFENSNYVALFPGSTPPLQMHRMFEKMGLRKELCEYLMSLGRKQTIRSIIIHKIVPMYIIFGNKIMLI